MGIEITTSKNEWAFDLDGHHFTHRIDGASKNEMWKITILSIKNYLGLDFNYEEYDVTGYTPRCSETDSIR